MPTTCSIKAGVQGVVEPHVEIRYKGLVDALRQIKVQEGYAGWFRGVGPRLLVHTPSVAISWTTYEFIKDVLEKSSD